MFQLKIQLTYNQHKSITLFKVGDMHKYLKSINIYTVSTIKLANINILVKNFSSENNLLLKFNLMIITSI